MSSSELLSFTMPIVETIQRDGREAIPPIFGVHRSLYLITESEPNGLYPNFIFRSLIRIPALRLEIMVKVHLEDPICQYVIR